MCARLLFKLLIDREDAEFFVLETKHGLDESGNGHGNGAGVAGLDNLRLIPMDAVAICRLTEGLYGLIDEIEREVPSSVFL
jgi:hypothetical protein